MPSARAAAKLTISGNLVGCWTGSARSQMQKISAGKFHCDPSLRSLFDHLVGAAEQR
jgi:hypothetical protein